MSAALDGVRALTALPGLAERVDAARDACTRLRWHRALRRRTAECAAESRVRGAWASGELEGARLSVDIVRDLMRGAVGWHEPPDPVEQVMHGVIAATAETEHLTDIVTRSPMQALARLHLVAAAGLVPAAELGRPRSGDETSLELTDLGAPPSAAEVSERLAGLGEVLRGAAELPGLVVAAVAHAEIATLRPFTRGNAVVARAVERTLVQGTGLDPTGVAVTEWGHGSLGGPEYVGALAAYGLGTQVGVRLWLEHCCDALERAAAGGERVADAVLAGRLG